MSFPKLSLVGDKERDAQILKRARREVRVWRFRAVLLALVAGLFFFRLRMIIPGIAFTVLAFGALQTARLTIRRIVDLQQKLAMLEEKR